MCCPTPTPRAGEDKFLLEFFNFGLEKKKKLQQIIPFPKDHVTFQQISPK
jgi:hypothetical protein